MKKILAVTLILALLMPFALCEIDLSELTFDELVALRDRCQAEMFKRDEWQEVVVPQGLWEVGKDIPAGTWTVRCADVGNNDKNLRYAYVQIGDVVNDTKTEVEYSGNKIYFEVYNPNNTNYIEGQPTTYTFTVKEGYYISISNKFNMVVFTNVKPSLGFK